MYRMENPWMMSDFLFSFHPFCKERDGVVMPGLKNFIQQAGYTLIYGYSAVIIIGYLNKHIITDVDNRRI